MILYYYIAFYVFNPLLCKLLAMHMKITKKLCHNVNLFQTLAHRVVSGGFSKLFGRCIIQFTSICSQRLTEDIMRTRSNAVQSAVSMTGYTRESCD